MTSQVASNKLIQDVARQRTRAEDSEQLEAHYAGIRHPPARVGDGVLLPKLGEDAYRFERGSVEYVEMKTRGAPVLEFTVRGRGKERKMNDPSNTKCCERGYEI